MNQSETVAALRRLEREPDVFPRVQVANEPFRMLCDIARERGLDLPADGSPEYVAFIEAYEAPHDIRAKLTRPVAEILSQDPYGNAYSDHDLWGETYRIALNTDNPIATRAAAIRKMDEITGCAESAGLDDETLVADFVTGMARDCDVHTFADGLDA